MEDAELQAPFFLNRGWKMKSWSFPLFSTVDGRCRATSPGSQQRMEDAEVQPPLGLNSEWKMQSYASPCSQQWMEDAELQPLLVLNSGWMIRATERFFCCIATPFF
jgi:hypothetical protein